MGSDWWNVCDKLWSGGFVRGGIYFDVGGEDNLISLCNGLFLKL